VTTSREAARFDGPTVHYRLTDSTNDRARELAAAGAPSGTVVVAAQQTAGRGRTGRKWTAPADSALLVSAILRPLEPHHSLLPLAIPLAVCEAAETLAPVNCRVKWPNDVWLEGRKVAGVLIEARFPDWAVIGVGLNLAIPDGAFPADLRWPATSLGHGVSPGQALDALREALGRWTTAGPDEVVAAFDERDALRGRRVAWEGVDGSGSQGEGVADGIDDRGNLVVVTDAGEAQALGSGEVTLRL
jgi:BirA family transcriptional regulator, biotin operon repressor / biotin---[acetyl-CoA-carboxylase] ligase